MINCITTYAYNLPFCIAMFRDVIAHDNKLQCIMRCLSALCPFGRSPTVYYRKLDSPVARSTGFSYQGFIRFLPLTCAAVVCHLRFHRQCRRRVTCMYTCAHVWRLQLPGVYPHGLWECSYSAHNNIIIIITIVFNYLTWSVMDLTYIKIR